MGKFNPTNIARYFKGEAALNTEKVGIIANTLTAPLKLMRSDGERIKNIAQESTKTLENLESWAEAINTKRKDITQAKTDYKSQKQEAKQSFKEQMAQAKEAAKIHNENSRNEPKKEVKRDNESR